MVRQGSSYHYYGVLFPDSRKERGKPSKLRRVLLDQEFLRRRSLRPCPVRQPHPGPTRIPGRRIRHFLVSEVKMKIRISRLRKPFFSKKTEARAIPSPWIFFFSLVASTISAPCLPGTCVESDDADAQASVSSAQSRRPLAPALAGRSDVEVAGWPSFQRNCLGAESPSRSRSAGLGEGRWRRQDSNRSRCRGRGQSLTVDEGGQAVHHGWEIWEGSPGALSGRGRGGWGWGGEEQRGRPGKPRVAGASGRWLLRTSLTLALHQCAWTLPGTLASCLPAASGVGHRGPVNFSLTSSDPAPLAGRSWSAKLGNMSVASSLRFLGWKMSSDLVMAAWYSLPGLWDSVSLKSKRCCSYCFIANTAFICLPVTFPVREECGGGSGQGRYYRSVMTF